MGRALLTRCARAQPAALPAALLAAFLVACGPEGGPAPGAGPPSDAGDIAAAPSLPPDSHRDLPCTACHAGPLTGSRIAVVPQATCTAAGCHETGGPPTVSTATATFRHINHGATSEIALSCAGCHTHSAGREPLRVASDGCALCHLTDMAGSQPADCRLCHQQPQHVALTSQGLPIPHSSLPWVETGCVRCHFDVAEPATRVAQARCSDCHGRDRDIIARGIATDLHPTHTDVTCTACHGGDAHRVRAMSSAVLLVCGDCHTREHGVALGQEWDNDLACASCHERVHQPQQRLLLGMLPHAQAAPSTKFIAGMTCRSCHVRTTAAQASDAAIRGQAAACASCHQAEYGRVLDWWLEGTRTRTRDVSAYVARAQRELQAAGPDTARQLLADASEMMRLVEEAGGQHNLEVSDRIFRESVTRVQRAYALAGRAAPAPPVLGSPAHEGMCSYCHYSPDAPWDFRRMSGPFHRSVMGVDR
jgi:hypothetical protein